MSIGSYGGHEGKLYYVSEATYGVIPETPAMIGIETILSMEPSADAKNIKLRGTGTRDLTQIKKGARQTDLKVSYVMPISGASDFLDYIMSLASCTIEIIYEKSYPQVFDLRLLGCRFDKATVECSVEDVIKASVDIIGQNLIPADEKIPEATRNDYLGAIPWDESYVSKGLADGSNLTVNERATDWKFTIENNLKRVLVIRKNPSSLLTGTATQGQKLVNVVAGSLFAHDDIVEIQDDDNWERNLVDSVLTNQLTMVDNLAYTYTVAKHGKVTIPNANLLKYLQERHRTVTGELTFEFESRDEFWDIVNDLEFSLKIGLGGTKYAFLKYCKWDNVTTPTKGEDLVSVKAPFTARTIEIDNES